MYEDAGGTQGLSLRWPRRFLSGISSGRWARFILECFGEKQCESVSLTRIEVAVIDVRDPWGSHGRRKWRKCFPQEIQKSLFCSRTEEF